MKLMPLLHSRVDIYSLLGRCKIAKMVEKFIISEYNKSQINLKLVVRYEKSLF